MKTGGDNCILTSNVLNFETEELLVGSKVCPGIVIIIEKLFFLQLVETRETRR